MRANKKEIDTTHASQATLRASGIFRSAGRLCCPSGASRSDSPRFSVVTLGALCGLCLKVQDPCGAKPSSRGKEHYASK